MGCETGKKGENRAHVVELVCFSTIAFPCLLYFFCLFVFFFI